MRDDRSDDQDRPRVVGHSTGIQISLKTNVAQVPRILPIHACVTGASQSAVRFTTDQAAWGNRIAADNRGVLVPAVTIEELCKQNGIEKIDLLKLDIEGAEEQVLENGTFLARTALRSGSLVKNGSTIAPRK